VAADLEPLSPQWWVRRLYDMMRDRREQVDFFQAYYAGDHPLPWLAPQARDEFRRILHMSRSNYMGLVVDALVERLMVEGFRLGSAQADKETWRIWQANNMDADSDQVILEAAKVGWSFIQVAPNPADTSTPFIYPELPSQCVVDYVPGTNRRQRAAALKDDDWTGMMHATLYLPDGLWKLQAQQPQAVGAGSEYRPKIDWEPRYERGVDEYGYAPNPLRRVPIVELANNPQLGVGGVSELYDVTDIQDRVNKTLADRLMTQDYGAFPQRWAVAWPDEDADGNPNPPLDVGRDRMVTTNIAETSFGQWDAAPLDPYSGAKREDVKDIASRTRTPAQYLLGEMSNVNGETLKASESGLISKVRQRQRTFGEGFEEAARLARVAAGISTDRDGSMETIWKNPEFRTEGELTDSLVKLQTLGIPLEVLWERYGFSPQQIERMKQLNASDDNDPVLSNALRALTGVAGGTGAGQDQVRQGAEANSGGGDSVPPNMGTVGR
jgi:hypothetical protein